MDRAFYTVADDRYFPGAVALVNSLRLTGHRDPIVVADCGLTREQRSLLERETLIVDGPPDRHPILAKCVSPLAHPARTRVLIDADIIVTRPLEPLLARAEAGHVVGFADPQARFFEEWASAVGVDSIARRPYINAGLVFLPEEFGRTILSHLERVVSGLDISQTREGKGKKSDPFYWPDQDCLNAVISAFVPAERRTTLRLALAPFAPFTNIEIADLTTLECYDERGLHPYVLHRIRRKPWLSRVYDDAYSIFLRRLVFGEDVPLRLTAKALPPRLRENWPGRSARVVSNEIAVWLWRGERLLRWSTGTRRRIRNW